MILSVTEITHKLPKDMQKYSYMMLKRLPILPHSKEKGVFMYKTDDIIHALKMRKPRADAQIHIKYTILRVLNEWNTVS